MASIIKRNVILTPAEYDGVANQKGIVTFEILGNDASGFLRCYNLEHKDNLIFGVKINDKMFKYKLLKGFDYLTFSLGSITNLQTAKISCVLVRNTGKSSSTVLIGSTETTSIYSNEILTFLNEDDLEKEKFLEDEIDNKNKSEEQNFKIYEFEDSFINDTPNKKEENILLNNQHFSQEKNETLTNQNNQTNELDEELSNYIDDLTEDCSISKSCKNCMYKNYFYCKNNNENNGENKETFAINSLTKDTITEPTIKPTINTQTAFYDSLSSQIDTLLLNNIHEEVLEDVLPNSTFVRINKESGSYYVLGVINNDLGQPEYLCYGHPAKNIEDKPFNYDNHFSFFPINVDNPEGEGYYLSYQSAQNGENVKINII